MLFRTRVTATSLLLVAAIAPSAWAAEGQNDGPRPTIVSQWNAVALAEIRSSKLGPPVAARALAIAHTCTYDAWAAYDRRAVGTVLGGLLRQFPSARTDDNKHEAISFAAYRCLLNLFPAGEARLTAFMTGLGYDPSDTRLHLFTPSGIGNLVAAAVLVVRRHDGSNQYGDLNPADDPGRGVPYSDYTGYEARNVPMGFCLPTMDICPPVQVADPFHWQPLIGPPPASATQKCVAPYWANVRPFALKSATQFDHLPIAEPQVVKSLAALTAASLEVLQHSAELTDAKKLIVEYWADGPASELPPGHWGILAQDVSLRDQHSIDDDAKMFFAMHNASFDAGIVAWHLKRRYDGVRPITGIRYLFAGQTIVAYGGPGEPVKPIPGEKWMPYNPGSNLTPAFPGFISGHSTFSAASAAVLRAFTGSDYFGFATLVPANFGRVEPGIPAQDTIITFETFTEAAEAAAMSRIFGGIHFAEDNVSGLALGDMIGRQAWEKAVTYFEGTARPWR